MAASFLVVLLLIPLSLLLGIVIGAVIYRAACGLTKLVVGPASIKTVQPDDYSHPISAIYPAAPSAAENNPFSAPSVYQNAPLNNKRDGLSPSFGMALLIVAVVGLSSLIAAGALGLFFRISMGFADPNAQPLTAPILRILLQVFSVLVQFGFVVLYSRLFLQTTWGRATLIAFFYYLIAIAFAVVIGLAVFLIVLLLAPRWN
jgi:hypothetical protein